ncbi:MFS transporter [Halobellus marinus]|uniref:MFS transporter n=1 Tax=Halobellus TaxID=1073986 RepID=UPI0028A69EC1|nr:MFS transporter [Halobellus sp. DFY28]
MPNFIAARVSSAVDALRGGGRGWTVSAVAGGWFFVLGLRFVIPALLPAIRADFPVSDTVAGAAITLLWVTYAAMQFPVGALIDRLGERTLLSASAVGGALAMAVYAVAPTFGVFLLATAGFGLASGLFGPPRGTLLSRVYTEHDGAAFGTVLAAGSVGAAVLPPAATYATGLVGWRGALALTAPGFLIAGFALRAFVPEFDSREDSNGTAETSDTNVWDSDAVARVQSGATAVKRAVSSRKVGLAVAGATLMLFVFQGVTAFLTTYFVTAKGLSEATAGTLFGLLFLSAAVFQSGGGALADRYGHGRVLAVVSFVGIVPLVALPYAEGLPALAAAVSLLGMRLSVGPISNAYIVALLPTEIRGTAWGALRTGFFIIGSFGSTAVGALADADLFAESFFLLAGLTGVAGVVFVFLPERGAEADTDDLTDA